MRFALTVFLASMLLGPAGVAGARTSALPGSRPGAEAADPVQAIGTPEPIASLGRASASFERRDLPAAATEIRRAATFLIVESGRVGAPGKTALEAEAASLRTLADEVEHGAVASGERISRALPRTRLALVAFFTAVAAEAWGRQEATEAGRALETGINELERAAAGPGIVLDDATAAAIGRARWFAGRLMQGITALPDDFRQAYEAVGTALDLLRKSLDDQAAAAPFGPAGPRLDDAAPRPVVTR